MELQLFSDKITKSHLDLTELHHQSMKPTHKKGNRGRIMHTLFKYAIYMSNEKHSITQKMSMILDTQQQLQKHTEHAENKNFGSSAIRKFHQDVYQKLHTLIPSSSIAERIYEAFIAMILQEKTPEFTKVVQAALEQNMLSSESFIHFLYQCIQDGSNYCNPM